MQEAGLADAHVAWRVGGEGEAARGARGGAFGERNVIVAGRQFCGRDRVFWEGGWREEEGGRWGIEWMYGGDGQSARGKAGGGNVSRVGLGLRCLDAFCEGGRGRGRGWKGGGGGEKKEGGRRGAAPMIMYLKIWRCDGEAGEAGEGDGFAREEQVATQCKVMIRGRGGDGDKSASDAKTTDGGGRRLEAWDRCVNSSPRAWELRHSADALRKGEREVRGASLCIHILGNPSSPPLPTVTRMHVCLAEMKSTHILKLAHLVDVQVAPPPGTSSPHLLPTRSQDHKEPGMVKNYKL